MDDQQLDPAVPAVAPPRSPGPVPWSVLESMAALGLWVLIQTAIGAVVGAGRDDLTGHLVVGAVGDPLAVLALIGLVRYWSRAQGAWPVLLGLRRTSWRDALAAWRRLAVGAAAYAAAGLAVAGVVQALGLSWDEVPIQPLVRMIAQAQSGWVVGFALAVAIVAAPVAEEMLFRSVLYQPLRAWLGAVPAALLVSALFALAHGYLLGAANLFIVSLTLVALFERTGTLWAPIAAHAAYNGLMVLLARSVTLPGGAG